MPTYTYECSSCEGEYDAIQSISDMYQPCQEPCRLCGKVDTVQKIIGGAPSQVRANLFKNLNSDHKYALRQMKKRHPKSNIKDY